MDLRIDPGAREFRAEVRDFLAEALPPHLRERGRAGQFVSVPQALEWQAILHAKGWGAPSWPTAFGGTGWPASKVLIFEEEALLAGAPTQNIQGFDLLAPVVMEFGTDAQCARMLPPLIEGKSYWCQGFSEPGSGSDLASLRTAAEKTADGWRINGSKIWTTSAHAATDIFLLVRTSHGATKHAGITFVVADMGDPAITVRPIRSIDGECHLNEVFLDDLIVPDNAVIGDVGQGWDIATFLLNNERISGLPGLKASVQRLRAIVRALDRDRTGHARKMTEALHEIELELRAMEMFAQRLLAAEGDAGQLRVPSSAFKIALSNLHQRVTRTTVDAMPEHAMRGYLDTETGTAIAGEYLYGRAISIYGGTNEIQKNIIGRALTRGG
ncbi:acyl-CoA dehydrogenase family protein [Pelagerythrobacter sp.]|uniref:acyl-CoA dehydrogenase family protein n=1 Tax=Pelagerythrobacter sp. TaxID=2800702 RepID=UPI0035AE5A89